MRELPAAQALIDRTLASFRVHMPSVAFMLPDTRYQAAAKLVSTKTNVGFLKAKLQRQLPKFKRRGKLLRLELHRHLRCTQR